MLAGSISDFVGYVFTPCVLNFTAHISIAAFFSPPNDAFMAVLERETLIVLFVAMGWAWACLGIKFADMSRTHHDSTVSFVQAVSGEYIEAAVRFTIIYQTQSSLLFR
jgi:hypothetical protein